MKIFSILQSIFSQYKPLCIIGLCLAVISPVLYLAFPYLAVLMLFMAFCGICCLIYALLLYLSKSSDKKIAVTSKVLRITALTLIAIFIISMVFIQIQIISYSSGDIPECDKIIVLGCGLNGKTVSLTLKYRLDTAINYLNTHPSTNAILCGGQGAGELVTEAKAMYDYMVRAGIDSSRLTMEDSSTDTTENIRNAKSILDDVAHSNVGIITNGFHIYRSVIIAKKAGINNAYGIAAKTPAIPFLVINLHLREYFSVIFEYLNL